MYLPEIVCDSAPLVYICGERGEEGGGKERREEGRRGGKERRGEERERGGKRRRWKGTKQRGGEYYQVLITGPDVC